VWAALHAIAPHSFPSVLTSQGSQVQSLPRFPPGTTQDLTGGRAHLAPKWTGRLGVDWSGELGSSGLGWDLNSNLSFVSDQFTGAVTDNNPQVKEDGYALLGARITINGKGDRWSLALFGNNLTNKQYSVGSFYQTLGAGLGLNNGVFPGSAAVRRIHADPRTVGISGTVRF
jgi:iron complex outermembrane receptor protein